VKLRKPNGGRIKDFPYLRDEFRFAPMKYRAPHRQAFSLIELLIVITVLGIIATFTIPAMNTVLRGSNLTQASSMLVGQLSLARQQALSRNRPVEVRFYRFGDSETPGEKADDPATGRYRAMQLFEVQSNGKISVPIDKIQRLPGPIVFAYTDAVNGLSSLIDKGTAGEPKVPLVDDTSAPPLPRGVKMKYEYATLRFMPDGSTDKSPIGKWFVTLININDKLDAPNKPPPNFFTVQIDPVSGTTRIYRPTAG
jgi:uncharacterized protein (TIGR02596 family)